VIKGLKSCYIKYQQRMFDDKSTSSISTLKNLYLCKLSFKIHKIVRGQNSILNLVVCILQDSISVISYWLVMAE
jgi:hypothetical protein